MSSSQQKTAPHQVTGTEASISNYDNAAKVGVLSAITAYSIWGFAPMYFKQLDGIPATEILLHRIVWSAVLLALLVVVFGFGQKVVQAVKSWRIMRVMFIAGILLGSNWLLFIWAIGNDKLVDSSLGYYINPLFNVFLGRVFLGEKLRPLQQVAVALATIGVVVVVVAHGYVPWIALILASTFGVYGLLRKQVNVAAIPGLFIETILLLPFAITYWVWFASDASNLATNSVSFNLLLIAAGIVTTAPLVAFNAAAKRLMYSTLGFFQYIGPTIMLCLAVFLYGEPVSASQILTFAFVWAGLVLYSVDSLRVYRQRAKQTRK